MDFKKRVEPSGEREELRVVSGSEQLTSWSTVNQLVSGYQVTPPSAQSDYYHCFPVLFLDLICWRGSKVTTAGSKTRETEQAGAAAPPGFCQQRAPTTACGAPFQPFTTATSLKTSDLRPQTLSQQLTCIKTRFNMCLISEKLQKKKNVNKQSSFP